MKSSGMFGNNHVSGNLDTHSFKDMQIEHLVTYPKLAGYFVLCTSISPLSSANPQSPWICRSDGEGSELKTLSFVDLRDPQLCGIHRLPNFSKKTHLDYIWLICVFHDFINLLLISIFQLLSCMFLILSCYTCVVEYILI